MAASYYKHPVYDIDSDPEAPTLDIQHITRDLLVKIGEDPDREGLLKTPSRVDKSMAYLTSGYKMTVKDVVNEAIFHEDCDDMVLVRDVEFYSLCEHHMLPFFGTAHVAYIPDGKVIGLSKIPRVVEVYARRLQVQERMTRQVAESLQEVLGAKGVAVITEARHLCMMMRGVEKQQSSTTCSCMLGAFRDSATTRQEFLQILGGQRG